MSQLTYQTIKDQLKADELVCYGKGKEAKAYSINEFQKRIKAKVYDFDEVCAQHKKTLIKRNFVIPKE